MTETDAEVKIRVVSRIILATFTTLFVVGALFVSFPQWFQGGTVTIETEYVILTVAAVTQFLTIRYSPI